MRSFMSNALVCMLSILFLFIGSVQAAEYKASLANMPVYAESTEKGVLVDFTKALSKAAGVPISIVVEPFPRSINNVTQAKTADFHMPLIVPPGDDPKDLDYSTSIIFHVNFVLYTNKDSKVARDNLDQFKIETENAHIAYIKEKTTGSASIENSLKKVDAGRLDGFIFADFACDPILKAQNLKNVKRTLYKRFDVRIVLPEGGKSGPVDKFLTETIEKLKANGEFAKILDPINTEFDPWQM
jgi:polar amino acid transport system substrate-binding protein